MTQAISTMIMFTIDPHLHGLAPSPKPNEECKEINHHVSVELTPWLMWFMTVFQVVSLAIGLMGNTLSFIILRRSANQNNSHMYLCLLSAADTCSMLISGAMLYLVMIFRTLVHFHHWDQLEDFFYWKWNTMPACAIRFYMNFVFKTISVYTIVIFTVERTFTVLYPLRSLHFTPRTAARNVGILSVISLIFNVPCFWGFTKKELMNGRSICLVNMKFFIMNYLDSVLLSLLPCLIVGYCNYRIIKALRERRGQVNNDHANSAENMDKQQMRVTKRLLLVSTVLIILTIPLFLVHLARNTVAIICPNRARVPPWSDLVCIALLLYNANFSVNFFIYCATGKKFRRSAIALLKCNYKRYNEIQLGHSSGGNEKKYPGAGGNVSGQPTPSALRHASQTQVLYISTPKLAQKTPLLHKSNSEPVTKL